jgi:hypothetical protein
VESCGLDTYDLGWSVTLREEYRLRVLGNRVLRSMFGPKREEVKGNCKILNKHKVLKL